jgi:hypothetical protein
LVIGSDPAFSWHPWLLTASVVDCCSSILIFVWIKNNTAFADRLPWGRLLTPTVLRSEQDFKNLFLCHLDFPFFRGVGGSGLVGSDASRSPFTKSSMRLAHALEQYSL